MKRFLVVVLFMLFAGQASALPLNSPVPSNAYITFDGLNWAWGGPCPYFSSSCSGTGDLTYQSTQGWRLPTAAELVLIPGDFANHFVFADANVPQGGTDPVSGAKFHQTPPPPGAAACASPYFNTVDPWCDWDDGVRGYWAGKNLLNTDDEQLYVRNGVSPVPEPVTLGLLGVGLAGLGAFRRRKAA